jgi:hypothetical protein
VRGWLGYVARRRLSEAPFRVLRVRPLPGIPCPRARGTVSKPGDILLEKLADDNRTTKIGLSKAAPYKQSGRPPRRRNGHLFVGKLF